MILQTNYKMKPPPSAKPIKGHLLSKGLIGLWPFNENGGLQVFDLSGNGYIGTLIGDVSWVPGKFGSALDFDGTGDYVNCGNLGDWTTKEVFVSVWVKFDDLTTTQNIVSKVLTNTAHDLAIEIGRTDKRITIVWANNLILTSGTDLELDTWYHIVVVKSGTTGAWGAKIYVNGVLDGSDTTAVNPTGGAGTLLFGAFRIDNLIYNYNGQIDNVMIGHYNPTTSEIALLYREPFCMFGRKRNPFLSAAAPPEVACQFASLTTSLWWLKHNKGLYTEL